MVAWRTPARLKRLLAVLVAQPLAAQPRRVLLDALPDGTARIQKVRPEGDAREQWTTRVRHADAADAAA